jgi:hypothetical protein
MNNYELIIFGDEEYLVHQFMCIRYLLESEKGDLTFRVSDVPLFWILRILA